MSELSDLIDKVKRDVRPELLRPAIAEALIASGVSLFDLRRIFQLWADNALVAKLDRTDIPGPDSLKEWVKPYLREWAEDFTGEMFSKFFARPD